METVKCNLCGSSLSKHLYTIENLKSFRIVKCEKCGFVYMNPRPTKKEIDALYNEDYFNGRGFDKGVNYIEGIKNKKYYKNIILDRLKKIESFVKRGSLLEIGSGLGDFLEVAKAHGWSVIGIETSKYASDFSKKLGLDIINSDFYDAELKENSFDVIVMIEVIEHLPDPKAAIKKCFSLLKENGIIIIQTGNIDGLYAKIKGKKWSYFLYGHLYYFSKKTLSKMLSDSGFSIIHIYNGDEISLLASTKCFWGPRNKKSIRDWLDYLKYLFIFISRKFGFGGMTVYATKPKSI